MRKVFVIIAHFILLGYLSQSYAQKTLNATRVSEVITVDGLNEEASWVKADVADNFKTFRPDFNQKPSQETTVNLLYDDEALYIYANLLEASRDSIMTELSQRDDFGNTDIFAFMLDTYGNGTDGLIFAVGATGVQYDALKDNSGGEDTSWDAVWFSDVNLRDDGWSVEIKIPYSAIRFSRDENQSWTINFLRQQARTNEQSFWNPVDPEVFGIFNQSGQLINLRDIKPPIRLFLSPYFSLYALHNRDISNSPTTNTAYTYSGGMDLKYGINDAFTLDMTLVPDFGQVESDDNVVNLSPFEVRFDEKRPFFTEGLEMFQKADIFYTRRVGGFPLRFFNARNNLQENEIIESNPSVPQLYNATKVSGRNKNGLGIGIFNAIEAASYATIRNTETNELRNFETQPLTNYNIVVFDKNLKNNSSISIINTNVWRKGAENYDANVTGAEFSLKDKEQKYEVFGEAAYSVQSFNDSPNNTGHKFSVGVGKISGNVNLWADYSEESPNYNPNDLGFLRAANERNIGFGGSYQIFEPFWEINRFNVWANYNYSRIIDPDDHTGWRINTGFWTQTKGFWTFNMWANYSPFFKDYFEPRVRGRQVRRPGMRNTGFFISSDSRKKFQASLFSFIYDINEPGRWGYSIGTNPRFRFNNKFSAELELDYGIQYDDTGYVGRANDNEIYMGQRDRLTIENLVGLNYNFTSVIGLNLRIRHYWDRGLYQSYHELLPDGELGYTDYDPNLDYEETFFNVDLNFNWRFAPGSDIFINWKNSIAGGHDNSLFNIGDINYFGSLENFSQYPQNNSISLRIVYFIDYLEARKWL